MKVLQMSSFSYPPLTSSTLLPSPPQAFSTLLSVHVRNKSFKYKCTLTIYFTVLNLLNMVFPNLHLGARCSVVTVPLARYPTQSHRQGNTVKHGTHHSLSLVMLTLYIYRKKASKYRNNPTNS